jgi:hypothetical protein
MRRSAVAVLLVLAQGAAAVLINVDLQPGPSGGAFSAGFAGQGALPAPGHDTWNPVAPPVDGYSSSWGSGGNFDFDGSFESDPLFDAEGRPTPVTISIDRGVPPGTTFAVNPSNAWAYDHVATDARNLMSDYLIAPGSGTNRVVLRHLKPGASYTLCLYGAGDQNTHQTTFRVAGATQTTRGVPHALHAMTAGGDYVVFTGVVAAADGTLEILYTGAGASRDGNFNGLQVQGELQEEPVP